ncbi:MFS transporter [Terrisporobacter petrolearius]|uniref:MFS transporter n=1 Tax=Terrisporobacter petrolearius TaxID=1460447 RepID=UPI001D16723C|nr:MFS transporter [Terrisporobacter petrolearius]MCC3863433.1 MFS transporter [Terrisporobacter petrolearius]
MNNILSTYKGLPREIYILFLGKIVNAMGAFVQPLMSLILTQKLGMSAGEAGELVTFMAVCQVPCIIMGGKLTDTIGRKKVITIFQIIGIIMLIICGIIPLSITTAKFMILSSCFYSISMPAYDALNADLTNESNRKSSYSLLYMGVNIGFSIGSMIGGFLYNNYLPLIFIGDAATTIVALLLIIFYIKEPNKQKEVVLDCEEEDLQRSTLSVILKRPILFLFPLMMLLFQFAYSQWVFTLPIQLGELFNEGGARLYGFLGGFNGIIVITFTPILTYFTKKYRTLNIMSAGGMLYGLSFIIYAFAYYKISFFVSTLALTIGEVLIVTNAQAFIANNTPPSHRGRISSIFPMISGTGYAIGPMIMGDVIDACGIFVAWMIITAVCASGAVGMILLKNLNNVND